MSAHRLNSAADAISALECGERLARDRMAAAFLPVLEDESPAGDVTWGALLAALHARGPTVPELLGLVDAIMAFDPDLRSQLANKVDLSPLGAVVAITGSGKETFKTFNVSTAAAFVAACHPGVCVVKPAGRATSAVTGASDVLEALGVRLPTNMREVADLAHRTGFTVFDYHLVAPRYGPRYEGRFHHLHPLSHVTPWLFLPIAVDGLLFGIAHPNTSIAAGVIAATGPPSAVVATTRLGTSGRIDEAAPVGRTTLSEVRSRHVTTRTTAKPVPPGMASLAQAGSHREAAAALHAVLDGSATPLAVALVAHNAAHLLRTAHPNLLQVEAEELAETYVARGDARRKLARVAEASRRLTEEQTA